MSGWLETLWRQTTSVPLPLLAAALALLTVQTLLVALSWRNVLRAAYPDGGVRYRRVLPYYAGGVGINAVLPASAGTVAMIGLFRAAIVGSTVAGLVGAAFAENLFFVVVAALVWLGLFIGVGGSFDLSFGVVHAHPVATVLIVAAAVAIVAVLVRFFWRRFRNAWHEAKEGAVVLRRPRQYAVGVVGPQLGSYAARMGVNATFMYAFGIPISARNLFVIVAASSVSSSVAIAPGGIGAQTALISLALAGVAPAGDIAAYAVGQQLIVTAWNVAFGAALLIPTVGWQGARALVRTRGAGRHDDAASDGPG